MRRPACRLLLAASFVLHWAGSPVGAQGIGGTDVNLVTGVETAPSVTQGEAFVWGHGSTILVAYMDGRAGSSNRSGLSVSTDGGATFERLNPSPFANVLADPTVVYNQRLGRWFATYIGNCPSGFGLWSSPDGLVWADAGCAGSEGGDRQSFWVDNNPASPFYGRMYMTYAHNTPPWQIKLARSDDGVAWTHGLVSPDDYRNVQVIGSPAADGTVFVAALDIRPSTQLFRRNYMYRSTDGGVSWSEHVMGAEYGRPGHVLCNSSRGFEPVWNTFGWGQPAVGPGGVVHYTYCGQGANAGDEGDIYYVRSTDNGATWSSPVVLNTDQAGGGTQAQWLPSTAVNPEGVVVASWYDRRDTTDGENYRYYGRISPDNGVSWRSDASISDILIPQPLQEDPGFGGACWGGDYYYGTTVGEDALFTWCDGRNRIQGKYQEDVYFDRVSLLAPDLIAGRGLGLPNPNEVRLLRAGGAATSVAFLAYGAGQWGVNVASADVNLGNYDEILTGPGPGATLGPQVRAFSRLGAPLPKVNFYAYGTLRWGANVDGAGADADTYDEILSGAGPGEVFGPHVRGWNFDGTVLAPISKINFFAYSTLRYGVNPSSGSVDADAFDEILTGPGPGPIFGPQVRGWDYDASTVTAISKINFLAYAVPAYGVNLAGGDLDADGFAEIATAPGPGAGSSFPSTFKGFDYDGSGIMQAPGCQVAAFTTTYGGRVGAGDLDGLDDDDLVCGAGRDPAADSRIRSYRYDGAALSPLPGTPEAFPGATFGVNVAAGNLGF